MAFDLKLSEGIAELVLDKPPVNALASFEWAALAEKIASLGRDPEVRVVLLAAEGRGFCAGVDIKELDRDQSLITAVNRGCYDAFAAVYDCAVPVIAAVHGFCLGGGIGLAGASDAIVASEEASFGLPEIDRGALGADAIIAQGGEGGGHTGTFPTSLLVPACVDAVDVPVIAAGGFRDGRGLVAALAYGAAGIAMGTRFLLTRESPVPDVSAKRYLEAEVDDVLVTNRIDGLPQRVVRNELVDRLERSSAPALLIQALRSALAYRKASGASLPELLRSALALRRHEKLTRSQMIMAANAPMLAKRGVRDGDPVGGYLPSGTVAGLIDDRPSCAELVGRIVEEAERTLAALCQRGS